LATEDILLHSQFRVASLNAGVALYSMGIVVASGVIGRFIYVRVHRGLFGERTSLRELRERAGLVEDNARSRLRFCPTVEQRLLDFEEHELRAEPGWATHLRQVTVLPLQQWITYVRCVRELPDLLEVAGTRGRGGCSRGRDPLGRFDRHGWRRRGARRDRRGTATGRRRRCSSPDRRGRRWSNRLSSRPGRCRSDPT
jgi:hypothetical protein